MLLVGRAQKTEPSTARPFGGLTEGVAARWVCVAVERCFHENIDRICGQLDMVRLPGPKAGRRLNRIFAVSLVIE